MADDADYRPGRPVRTTRSKAPPSEPLVSVDDNRYQAVSGTLSGRGRKSVAGKPKGGSKDRSRASSPPQGENGKGVSMEDMLEEAEDIATDDAEGDIQGRDEIEEFSDGETLQSNSARNPGPKPANEKTRVSRASTRPSTAQRASSAPEVDGALPDREPGSGFGSVRFGKGPGPGLMPSPFLGGRGDGPGGRAGANPFMQSIGRAAASSGGSRTGGAEAGQPPKTSGKFTPARQKGLDELKSARAAAEATATASGPLPDGGGGEGREESSDCLPRPQGVAVTLHDVWLEEPQLTSFTGSHSAKMGGAAATRSATKSDREEQASHAGRAEGGGEGLEREAAPEEGEQERVLAENSDSNSDPGSISDESTDEETRRCIQGLQEEIDRAQAGIEEETTRADDRKKQERERLKKEKKERKREEKRKEIENSKARLAELKAEEDRLKEARRKKDGKAPERRESTSRAPKEVPPPSTPVREEVQSEVEEDEDDDEKLRRELDEAVPSPEQSLRLAKLLGFESVFELARCARGLKKTAPSSGLSPAENRRKKRTRLEEKLKSPLQKRRRSPGTQDTPATAPPKKKNAWDTCGKEVSRMDLPARQAFVVPAAVVAILKEGFQVPIYLSQLTEEESRKEAFRNLGEDDKRIALENGKIVVKTLKSFEAMQAADFRMPSATWMRALWALVDAIRDFYVPKREEMAPATEVADRFAEMAKDVIRKQSEVLGFETSKLYVADIIMSFARAEGNMRPDVWCSRDWDKAAELVKHDTRVAASLVPVEQPQPMVYKNAQGTKKNSQQENHNSSASSTGKSQQNRGYAKQKQQAPSSSSGARCIYCGGRDHYHKNCPGGPACRCRKDANGHWKDKNGAEYCIGFNTNTTCRRPVCEPNFLHACSLCGSRDHGAQTCPN
ncbi:hypothetical protein BDZ89DRAFT_1035249 [Hymenopellis radicata]|nr:hypothetical protein BDZ89DRAFT_1035249 [Hymenopellis radicata]